MSRPGMAREIHRLILGSLVRKKKIFPSFWQIFSHFTEKIFSFITVYLTDTIPPTATISTKKNYTNAKRIDIDIEFSEGCVGRGGFKCVNSSDCDVSITKTCSL